MFFLMLSLSKHDACRSMRPLLGPAVPQIDNLTDDGGQKNQGVRHNEHPIAEEPGIHHETNRRGALADEQPAGHAGGRAVAPLRVDLPSEGQKQNGGGRPADQFGAYGSIQL